MIFKHCYLLYTLFKIFYPIILSIWSEMKTCPCFLNITSWLELLFWEFIFSYKIDLLLFSKYSYVYYHLKISPVSALSNRLGRDKHWSLMAMCPSFQDASQSRLAELSLFKEVQWDLWWYWPGWYSNSLAKLLKLF